MVATPPPTDTERGPDISVYNRIDFLMRYLGWHVGERLGATVTGLRRNLDYPIPTGVPDPDRRYWCDPVVPELSTIILAAALDVRRTTGFSLRGHGRLAGLGIHSCGCTDAGGLCWTTAFELVPGERVSPQTFYLIDALWSDRRWHRNSSFDFCWLEPWPHTAEDGARPGAARP